MFRVYLKTIFVGDIDYSSVEQAITSITTNLPEMSQGVRVLAALTPTGDHLLDAARKLCSAFTDLLKAVQPDTNTVRSSFILRFINVLADVFNIC